MFKVAIIKKGTWALGGLGKNPGWLEFWLVLRFGTIHSKGVKGTQRNKATTS